MKHDEPKSCSTSGEDQAASGTEAIDFDLYLPTVLSKLVSKLRRSANLFFGAQYGITLLEWRILSFIAAAGPTSAYAIWTEGELDKAAVSRAVREMQRRDLVAVSLASGTGRKKSIVRLTAAGQRLHEDTLADVLRRHARLIGGMSPGAVRDLLDTLNQLERRIPVMATADGVMSKFRPTKRSRDR